MILAGLTLIIALVSFIISTRPWPLPSRLAVWLVGSVFLGLSAFFATMDANYQSALLALLAAEGGLLQAIARGRDAISRLVSAQWDVFLFMGLLVGIVGLLALSPGEANEKAVGPVMIGTIGAVAGGMLMLLVVAVIGAI